MNARQKKFLVELIKPSHYDDQGYIIQWWRGFIPSNSLSCLYGLALDVSERRALGDDVDIDIEVRDETNVFIPIKKIIRRFAENGNCGLVCLVGVQTNQFARAVDIAVGARLRRARLLTGASRRQLGEAMGVGAETVRRYETGARRMSPVRLAAAVRFLGLPLSWFFREDGPPAPGRG